MKHKFQQAAAHIGLFCTLLALLWALLSLSAAIPNEALYERFARSALSYGQVDAFHFHRDSRWNSIADNYADAILLNLAWNMGTGDHPFAASVDTDYYEAGTLGQNAGLYFTVVQNAAPNADYTRYWHGSAMFVRLLHLVTDVEGMKAMGTVAVLLLVAATAAVLLKAGHTGLSLALLLSLAAVQMWNIRLSLEYQTAFLVTFLLCPMYLLLEKRDDRCLSLLSTAGGVLIAFFDFLTAETLTILLPLILVTAVRTRENRLRSWKEEAFFLLRCGLCWAAAYAGTFLLKWTAATLVTGENAFALAFDSAAQRLGAAEVLGEDASRGILSGIGANLTTLFGGTQRLQPVRIAAGITLSLGVLGSVWYLFPPRREGAVLILLLGSMVLVRFLVLNNHSYYHEFFTYRALASTVLSLLAAMGLNVALPGKKRKRR